MASAEDAGTAPSKRIRKKKSKRPAPAMPAGLTSWDPLPETLIREVASCLCMKECFQAIRVSKPWHAAINSTDMWMQQIVREWPDVQVVVSRLEADAPGQSELCKSLRELCLKMLKSSRGKEKKESGRRSAADYERLRKEAEERRRKRFADVFVRIHITNRHTEEVLYTKTASMSDPAIVNELFCGNGHVTAGLHEHDLKAYEDYKVAVSLIDLGGDGLRVAELVCLQQLEVLEVYEEDGFAAIYSCSDSCGYGLGSKDISVDCGFSASRLKLESETASRFKLEPEEDEEDYYEEDELWELCLAFRFTQRARTDQREEWAIDLHKLEDVSAVYEFLEPFVNTCYLLKWH